MVSMRVRANAEKLSYMCPSWLTSQKYNRNNVEYDQGFEFDSYVPVLPSQNNAAREIATTNTKNKQIYKTDDMHV